MNNAQTKEDKLLLAQLEDKQRQAEDRYMIVAGDFLDAHQRKLAMNFCRSRGLGPISCKGWRIPAAAPAMEMAANPRSGTESGDGNAAGTDPAAGSFPTWSGVRVMFYGGYAEAERCMPVFLPDYAAGPGLAEELGDLVRVVRVRAAGAGGRAGKASGAGSLGRRLTHRDYLGSLLALGLDRAVTGDILVREAGSELGPGADIIVEAEMADFIELNYSKAGRVDLSVEVLPITALHIEPARTEDRQDTVASLRLDNLVASAFRLSRARAAEAIRRGMVSVNSAEALKVDAEVEEGDRIVLRGQGRVILSEVGGSTRKDRIRIRLTSYL